jgi:hypothetical protein
MSKVPRHDATAALTILIRLAVGPRLFLRLTLYALAALPIGLAIGTVHELTTPPPPFGYIQTEYWTPTVIAVFEA